MRLGVNIDHVATIRNARGTDYPSPLRAAHAACRGGADSITVHARGDRRHITEADVKALAGALRCPLNVELAPTAPMLAMVCDVAPAAACFVPERREELTTEGGLALSGVRDFLRSASARLKGLGTRVSFFIEPDLDSIREAKALGAAAIELHTGRYSNLYGAQGTQACAQELSRIRLAAELGDELGLEVHAGHGLTYENVADIASIPQICELNIGHFIVSESIFCGLEEATRTMRSVIGKVRRH